LQFKLVMPKFTETMQEGTIVKWYKREGEIVNEGEPIVEIVGEKLTYDVESPAQGKLLKILQSENSNVPIGEVIAFIGDEMRDITLVGPPVGEKALPPEPKEFGKRIEVGPRVAASPLAKKLARESGVDLTLVHSSTAEGRITEADVIRFLESRSSRVDQDKGSMSLVPLTGVRKTIAERMTVSSQVPRITLVAETSASDLLELQRQYSSRGIGLSPTDVILKAVALALKAHPTINSSFEDDQVKIFERINVGIAVATDHGLLVPVVKDADKRSISELAAEVASLTQKARSSTLTEEDVKGGTFTVTNLGMFDVDIFTPLINPPQCAILGVGRIAERPVVVEGKVLPKPTMTLSLSFDHRIVDGVPAAKFLRTVKELVEDARGLAQN